ncbi:MAG TPA: class I SAM-dependent methyltransferase [Pseudonocardiaceae bacterium]|nr:class I SAM-dependent methyltransferase [Pseudonocardiaceae bacterium]
MSNRINHTEELDEQYRTRPGTPMIGPYSVQQMDDFYAALAAGEVKPTGIMNYLQRLLITARCRPGDRVLDVCCGRGLQLPVLYRYRRDLGGYLGLDISVNNLAEAEARRSDLDALHGREFPVELRECDVAVPWPDVGSFDVVIYTSALEHLPRECAVASLRHTAAVLAPGARLYLSTPNTPGEPPRKLQHRVHVYEWSHEELTAELGEVGLEVLEVVGILPPATAELTETAVAGRYGDGAAKFYRRMRDSSPEALLGPVVATALDEAASELLYIICARTSA